jgi:hypothetical protein
MLSKRGVINSMNKIIIKLSSLLQLFKDPGVATTSTSPARPVQVEPHSVIGAKTHSPVPSLGMLCIHAIHK